MTREQVINQYMKSLQISYQEAEELYNEDKRIEKMSVKETQNDLTEEQKKIVKNSTKIGQKTKKPYNFSKRERKPDTEKEFIIAEMANFLQKIGENVEILNKNNEISMEIGENSYSIKLVKHRKPKEKATK